MDQQPADPSPPSVPPPKDIVPKVLNLGCVVVPSIIALVVGVGVWNRTRVLDHRDAGRAAMAKGEWEAGIAAFEDGRMALAQSTIVFVDRQEFQAEHDAAEVRWKQVQEDRQRAADVAAMFAALKGGDLPAAGTLAAKTGVAPLALGAHIRLGGAMADAALVAMTDAEFTAFVESGTVPGFLDGLEMAVFDGLRARARQPGARDAARKAVDAGAQVRRDGIQRLVDEQAAADAQTSFPEPFQIRGRVTDRQGDTLLVFGRAMPTRREDMTAEGAVVAQEANLRIDNANCKPPFFTGVGGFYGGQHYFRGTSTGTNRLGGTVPIYLYGDIPPDVQAKRDASTAQFERRLYAKRRLMAGDPEEVRKLGVKELAAAFKD